MEDLKIQDLLTGPGKENEGTRCKRKRNCKK